MAGADIEKSSPETRGSGEDGETAGSAVFWDFWPRGLSFEFKAKAVVHQRGGALSRVCHVAAAGGIAAGGAPAAGPCVEKFAVAALHDGLRGPAGAGSRAAEASIMSTTVRTSMVQVS